MGGVVKALKPTATWNSCDMLWVTVPADGKPRFVLDHAYFIQGHDGHPKWATLDVAPDLAPGPVPEPIDYIRTEAPTRDRPLIGDHPVPHAVIASSDGRGAVLYAVEWPQTGNRGNGGWQPARRIFVLHARDHTWRMIGECQSDDGGHVGYAHGIRQSVTYRVQWIKDAAGPPKIHLTFANTDVELGEEAHGLPDRTTFRQGVIEAPFPADFRFLPGEYTLCEKGDTLDKVIHRMASWDEWESRSLPKKRPVGRIWRNQIFERNPSLPRHGELPEGTRVFVPSYTEWVQATGQLAPSPRPTTAPVTPARR